MFILFHVILSDPDDVRLFSGPGASRVFSCYMKEGGLDIVLPHAGEHLPSRGREVD